MFLCFSPIWQEILHSIHDKKKTNLALIGMSATVRYRITYIHVLWIRIRIHMDPH
jgi:hypothetical protein